jgi:hypothetical protein
MKERPLTDSAGSVGRETEDRPFTETASACARARWAAARLTRRLVQRRMVVVVVGEDKATKQQRLLVVTSFQYYFNGLIPSDVG